MFNSKKAIHLGGSVVGSLQSRSIYGEQMSQNQNFSIKGYVVIHDVLNHFSIEAFITATNCILMLPKLCRKIPLEVC